MPLDTRIALGVQPVQLEDPDKLREQRMRLDELGMRGKVLQGQLDASAREQTETRALSDLYRGAVNADGTINREAVLSGAASGGMGHRIPALQKQWAETDEATGKGRKALTDADAAKWKLAKDRLDIGRSAVSSMLSIPPAELTHQAIIQRVTALVQQGLMPPDAGQNFVQQMPGRQEALRGWLIEQGLTMLDADKRLQAAMPKWDIQDTGKQKVPVDMNPITNPAGPGALTMTTTPGQDQQASTAAADRAAANSRAALDRASREKIAADQLLGKDGSPAAKVRDAKEALELINSAEPLLKGSTGSRIGAGLDWLSEAFGVATPGSVKTGQLKALEGMLIAKMPKMSGPQSDKDVLLYRQMAGEIGDPNVPYERKKAALDTIRGIQERYAGVAPGSSKPVSNDPYVQAVNPPATGTGTNGVVDWGSLN